MFNPPRPQVTDEMIQQAADELAKRIDADAGTIAQHYRYGMDGYELGKELERHAFWDMDSETVSNLDDMTYFVDRTLEDACKQWVADNNIQPPLAVGTETTEGEITGICEHKAATYLIKSPGHDDEKDGVRRRLIDFEDAVAA